MDAKERFTDRVDLYVKYRPDYPEEALDFLYGTIGFRADSVIADVGAGTGIFARRLLERGSTVHAVEPNGAMLAEARRTLAAYPNFHPVPGSAEETLLADASVDFVTCAQSFHWFDREAARREFRRILKPGGKVVLIWNSRRNGGTPFLDGYERLLRQYGTDYLQVRERDVTRADYEAFFASGMGTERFTNRQLLDFDGIRGRLLSSSYAPLPGHPNHKPMMEELRALFDETNENGRVDLLYDTKVIWGTL